MHEEKIQESYVQHINKVLYQTDGFSLNRISLNKPTNPFAILA